MFRIAVREVLARRLELGVVAEAGSVAEAIACLTQQTFDVAIVDLVLPDARGLAFVEHLLDAQPDCKVLVLSAIDEPTQMAELLRSGALGFALKSQPVGEIVDAVRCVLAGGRSVPEVSRDQVDQLLASKDGWPLERLTPRERQIFDLLVAGDSSKDMAAKLFISTRTVETHRQRVMNKLAAHSLSALFRVAQRHGLVG